MTAALQRTASEMPNARKIMPINKTITARLYQVLATSTLCLPLAVHADAPTGEQPKLPSPAASAPALPVQGTFTAPVTEERFSRTVAPGIELTTIMRNGGNGPLQLFVTRVNLRPENSDVRWKLRLAPAEYSVLKAATVTAISRKEKAVVAINGGYFAFGGAALGAVKVDNEWVRLPLKNRTAMGIDDNGRVLIDNLQASAKVIFGEAGESGVVGREISLGGSQRFNTVSIGNLNGYAPTDGTTVLSNRFGKTYTLRPDETAFEVENGVVRAKVESGIANVSEKGWTLVAHGAMRLLLSRFSVGQTAAVQVNAPATWNKYSSILGAGPRLLRRGKIETTEASEEFRPDVIARGPRSAIGVDRHGQLWFLVADGRAPEYSVGLTLSELAAEIQKLGAVEAICLDGGGSTAMTINNILVNRPSDGSERRVSNALVVTADETSAQ